MHKKLSKVLAFVLSLAIVFSYVPVVPAYADGLIADKYVITTIKGNWDGSAYDIDFEQAMTEADFGHLVSVEVNGEAIAKDKFRFYYGGIRTEDAEVIEKLTDVSKEDVKLIFDDQSTDDNGNDDQNTDDNGTVNDDNTVLTYQDGATLEITNIEKVAGEPASIVLSFDYKQANSTKSFYDRVYDKITAITIDEKDVSLVEGASPSYVIGDGTLTWYIEDSNSTAMDLDENFAEYETHGTEVTFAGDNKLVFGDPKKKDAEETDTDTEETDTVVLDVDPKINVTVIGVGEIIEGTNDDNGKAVTVTLDITLDEGTADGDDSGHIWKYCGVPSPTNQSRLVSIKIDERDIAFKDSNGISSFVFSNNAYTFNEFGDNDVAADLVADFAKRDKHRVEVEYTDGTIVYEDEGYVKRTDLDDDNGNGDDGNNDDGTTGDTLADKYIITEVKSNWDDTAVDIDFEVAMTEEDFGHLVSVEVNGEIIAKDKFRFYYGGIRTEDAEVIEKLKAVSKEDVKLIFDDQSDDTTNGKIADKYQIIEVKKNGYDDVINVKFNENISDDDYNEIESVTINGEKFTDKTKFRNFYGDFRVSGADVVAAFQKVSPAVVAITFSDDSVLTNGSSEQPELTVTEIKKVVVDTTTATSDKEVIVIVFDQDFSYPNLDQVVSVVINDQTFTEILGRSHSRANSDELKEVLYLDNAAAMDAINDTSSGKLNVVVNFKDFEPMTYQKDVFDESDKYGFEGFAEDKSIVQLTSYEHFKEKKQMLSIKLDTSLLSADAEKVKSVTIEDETFSDLTVTVIGDDKDRFAVHSDDLEVKLIALQQAGKDIDQLPFILTFSDDSQLAKNTKLVDNNKIDLAADLADGEYTVKFRAYKVGTDELSMMNGYFDRRAKLVVENGEKTICFALTKFAADAVDLALEQDGTLVSMPVEKLDGGKVGLYSSPIDKLTERVEMGALVDAGPFSASEGDIGNWSKYAKADIEFVRLSEGFAEFKFEEEARIEKARNLENLTEALIANGVDTDNDGVISTAELQNATGNFGEIYVGRKENNVLDLNEYHISDISLLKDLGPGVKHLLLSENDIEVVPADAFANATGLETIELSNNKLKQIDVDAFKGLQNLTLLSMTVNPELKSLPEGLLAGNDKLEELYLNGCSLETVGSDLLRGKTELNTLFLQENKLKFLADDFFADQNGYALVDVNLTYNQLENLPSSLGDTKNLNKLLVNNNNIKALPNSIKNLKKLIEGDFSHNQIAAVPTEFLVNLAKLAQSHKDSVMIDFTDNYIAQLDLDAIMAAQTKGNDFRKFNFELNNLMAQLTEADKQKLAALGVDFEGYSNKFTPQKTNAELKAEGVAGQIKLTQTFDVAELYLWKDVNYFIEYHDSEDFAKYLETQYKIHNKPTREANLKAVLEANNVNWKIQTIITKNDDEEVYNNTGAANTAEPLQQTFTDASMRDGEVYVVTKILYLDSIFGWQQAVANKASFIARDNGAIQEGEVQKIGVKALITGQDELSMMSGSIDPFAELELKDGKYTYTIRTDVNVDNLKLYYNGQAIALTGKQVDGQYPLQYSFTVDQKLTDRVKADFRVIVMNKDMSCDLLFDYDVAAAEPTDPVEQTVKAYILKTDKSALSMANQSLDQQQVVFVKKDDQTYTMKLQFNPMSFGQVTAGVSKLFVELNGQFAEATAADGGKFTIDVPASLVKSKTETTDTEMAIKIAIYPVDNKQTAYQLIDGHNAPVAAILLLDWNGDYQPPKPGDNDTTEPGDNDTTEPGDNDTTEPGDNDTTEPGDDDTTKPGDDDTTKPSDTDTTSDGDDESGDDTSSSAVGTGSTSNITSGQKSEIVKQVKVDGEKATIVVDETNLTKAIEGLNSVTDETKQVVIKADVDNKVKQVKTDLTKSTIADIAAKAGASLKLEGNDSSVIFDGNSLQMIAKSEGKNVEISTLKGADGELTVAVKIDGKSLNDPAARVTVVMPGAIDKAGQVVVLVNADGSQTVIKKSCVIDGAAYAEVAANATIKVVDNSKVFDDIAADSPYYDVVAFASSHELFKGNSATEFSPEGAMTRAMLVTVLHRLEGAPSANKNYFSDVAEDAYYFDAVAWATKAGIVEGYNGKFDPDAMITRQQILTILHRYMAGRHFANAQLVNLNTFSDGAEVSDWAKDSMQWAISNGVLQVKGGMLKPKEYVTRAEVAGFMQKVVEMQLTAK